MQVNFPSMNRSVFYLRDRTHRLDGLSVGFLRRPVLKNVALIFEMGSHLLEGDFTAMPYLIVYRILSLSLPQGLLPEQSGGIRDFCS